MCVNATELVNDNPSDSNTPIRPELQRKLRILQWIATRITDQFVVFD